MKLPIECDFGYVEYMRKLFDFFLLLLAVVAVYFLWMEVMGKNWQLPEAPEAGFSINTRGFGTSLCRAWGGC